MNRINKFICKILGHTTYGPPFYVDKICQRKGCNAMVKKLRCPSTLMPKCKPPKVDDEGLI